MESDWVPHIVRKGETLGALAYRRRTTVAKVWNHSKNADLKAKRKNPNVLAPGDMLWLPPDDPTPTPIHITPGDTITVSLNIPRHTVKVKLHDDADKPLASVPFEVDGGLVEPDAKTDGDGVATFETWVTTNAVTLRLPTLGRELPVLIGALDPLATRSGAIGRLRNLGLYCNEPRDADAEAVYFRSVLLEFQEKYDLKQTGELDQATQDKLAELAGDDGTWEED
jgi:N-acetylmuramoyl-L-alanine amidase